MMNWEIQANHNDIISVVKECAFNKVCAALGIGPQLPTATGFDLICYDNAIQFSMEKCEPVGAALTDH
jgi:hypothetical protein